VYLEYSDNVVQDSIRVNGGQAKSQNVVILEVMFGQNHLKEADPSTITELSQQIEQINEEMAVVTTTFKRVQDEENWLNGFADSVKNPNQGKSKEGESVDFLDQSYLAKVFNFMKFYRDELEKIDEKRRQCESDLKKKREKLSSLKSELLSKKHPLMSKKHVNEVTILVRTNLATTVDLMLCYVLLGPSCNHLMMRELILLLLLFNLFIMEILQIILEKIS